MTLIIDPVAELADDLAQMEDRLLWADVDDATTIQLGAGAAGDLCVAVRRALADAPRLYAPERTELALLAEVPTQPLRDALDAIKAAFSEVAYDRQRYRALPAALALLTNCVQQDGTQNARLLAGVLSHGGTRERWLAVEGEDDLRGMAPDEIGTGSRRWATRLTRGEHAAYRGFVASVLDDPMERFAATGALSASPEVLRSALIVRRRVEAYPCRQPAAPSDTPRVQSFGVDL